MAHHFFEKGKRKHSRPDLRLRPDLLPAFAAYRWPGNVRQSENLMERLNLFCDGDEVTMSDLPEQMRAGAGSDDLLRIEFPPDGLDLEAVEKELLTKALDKFHGNQTRAASYRTSAAKLSCIGWQSSASLGVPHWNRVARIAKPLGSPRSSLAISSYRPRPAASLTRLNF